MKLKNLVKKIATYVCMATLVVGTMSGIAPVTASAVVLEDIILNGDDGGASAMIGYEGGTGYKYQFATLKDAPSDYKYMIITYSGSVANLRMEFAYVGTEGETAKVGPYWLNPAQTTKFTTVGTASMDAVEEGTVVIDLEASGLSLADYNSVHIHNEQTEIKIGYARLSTSSEIIDADVMPEGEETTTPSETVKLEDIELTGIVGTYAPEGEGYAYLAGMDVNAQAGYRYLALTYTGDETAFKDFRIELTGMGTIGLGENPYEGAAIDWITKGAVPAPTEKEQRVIIDLAASGLDITKAITNIHLHQTAGNGSFTITEAYLISELEEKVDPSTLEDIILNGDENGQSSMMKTWKVKASTGNPYKYLGFVTLKEPTSDYKYLILTYAGDISTVRCEFAYVDENGIETDKSKAYWFAPTQEYHFVTVDGSDISLNGGKGTTIVIDLEATGIDLGMYNSVHMHGADPELLEFELNIGMARLSTKAELNAALDVMPTETPTTEPATKAPETTVAPTTKAAVKVGRTKVKSATKKKAAKKVKISLKKINGAKGYKVQFSTTKKFKKTLVTKTVKKTKVTINSKKLKNKKKLFVRAKAYKLDGKKKVWSKKWSKVKKVKIK